MGRGEAEAEQHLIKKDRDGRGEDGQHQIKNASRRGDVKPKLKPSNT